MPSDPERRLISRDSLKIILTQRGTNPIDDEQADEFLNEFDTNGDGMYDIQGIPGTGCTIHKVHMGTGCKIYKVYRGRDVRYTRYT
ncbi:hypothetical protein DPMN_131974 [Dreissena polymorpha]|uniref:EF-hand domain-containing protein n=1 Tax=Dreissena polymorpha TaxID=45954 RepID=A0A9D4JDB5_DREPO|nr:hypothetical protein DPMN_131974 [Dreissena polymorpha]